MSTQSWQDFYNPFCRGPHKLRVSANNLKVKLWLSSQTRIVIWNWMWMSQEKPPTNVAFANCFFFSSQKARPKKLQVCGDYFDIALWFLIDLAQWGCPACCLPTCRALLTCWPLFCSVQFLNRACFSSVFCSYVWHVPAYCLCSIPWYGWLIPSVVFLKVVVLCSALFLELTCAMHSVHACSLFPCQPSPCTLIQWFRAVWGKLERA